MSEKSSSTPTHLFPLGRVMATPGALDLLDSTGTNGSDILQRHVTGDWSGLLPEDSEENKLAIAAGGRILSSYEIGRVGRRIWVITEADRSVTTLLLPEEY